MFANEAQVTPKYVHCGLGLFIVFCLPSSSDFAKLFQSLWLFISVFVFFLQKIEFDVDSLSKPELRMLLSVMEGELEARDLVIEALRVSYWVVVVCCLFFLFDSLLPLPLRYT